MEIQQHDGVVVEAAVISAGLRQAPTRERERCYEGRGRRQGLGCGCPPSPPTIYRAPRGAPALEDPISKGGGGQGGTCPPSQVGRPHP